MAALHAHRAKLYLFTSVVLFEPQAANPSFPAWLKYHKQPVCLRFEGVWQQTGGNPRRPLATGVGLDPGPTRPDWTVLHLQPGTETERAPRWESSLALCKPIG